jgi:diguanylate cyclase (GGDEF)-like protein/putative nucleotidyltransferase with HDIG domain
LLGAAAFLAAHLAGAVWGQSFALVAGGASAWYPPAGLTIAYLVLVGWRAVPVVALANLVAMVAVFGAPLAPSQLLWAIALACSYLPFTALVRGLGFREPLGRQRDLALLVALGALGAPALGALVGADWLVIRGVVPPDGYVDAVRSWFIGDALGVLTVAPLVLGLTTLVARRRSLALPTALSAAVALVEYVAVVTVPLLEFRDLEAERWVIYLSFLPVVWLAVRHGLAGATLAVAGTNTVIVLAGSGETMARSDLYHVQLFMGVVAIVGLFVGTAVSEQRGAERRLVLIADGESAFRRIAAAAASLGADDLLAFAAIEAAALAEPSRVVVVDDEADPPAGYTMLPIHVGTAAWGSLGVSPGVDASRVSLLGRLTEVLGSGLESVAAREALSERAASDPLTGLVNHRTFHERLREEFERATRHGRDLSVVVFDVDGFKAVNEVEGHLVGDAVLRELAARLATRIRTGNVLARIGGDEFAVIVPEAEAIEAVAVAERLRRAIVESPLVGRHALTVSAGVCDRSHASTAADLLRLADGALYWAKVNGRDRAWIYSPEIAFELSAEERADHLARTQALTGIRALARAIDAKDPSTRQHSERVAALAVQLARAVGWPDRRIELLEEAALVHDVGKIGVPDAVLLSPGRLSADEYEQIKLHAALGAQIASEVLGEEQVSWIRSHHERPDGKGYPDGLAAGAIPDGSLLLALADSWDVMTSERPYSAPMPTADALAECRRCAGTQFDPTLIPALERVLAAHVAQPKNASASA